MADFVVKERLTGAVAGESEPGNIVSQSILYLNDRVSSELALIRIAIGTATIEFPSASTEWRATADLSILGAPASTVATRANLIAELAAKGLDRQALDRHLRRNLGQNAFYQELVGELLHAIARDAQEQHTLAFVHVYRLLERISYAFPVIYAARTSDFKSSYTKLRDFFGTSDKGELGFFNKFVDSTLDSALTDATTEIDLRAMEDGPRQKAFTRLREFLNGNVVSETSGELLEVNNKLLLGLMITVRNRFFHFASNHDQNLSSIDVPDPDSLFKCLYLPFVNWIMVIYFEILRWQVSI